MGLFRTGPLERIEAQVNARLAKIPPEKIEEIVDRTLALLRAIPPGELAETWPKTKRLIDTGDVINNRVREMADDLDTNDDGEINLKDIRLPTWLSWCAPLVTRYFLRK